MQAFHPAVRAWFEKTFPGPTNVQQQAWPSVLARQHTLLAAPTGSGKTLAAFLAAIDNLIQEGLERGLPDATRVLYISPLKALSNDIQRNLQQPLQGIRDELLMQGLPDVDIRAWVRTGDTPQSERVKARRTPPHILVTTPESVYILLTSESGRRMLSTVNTVIVDEIHAVAGSKRGAHLALSLERLQALTSKAPMRIGLSATQKPIQDMAHFLVGHRDEHCNVIDVGQVRERDLALEMTGSPLGAVMSNEVWSEIYDRLNVLIENHHTTLVFVNTRRLAERAARFLAERIGEEHIMSHHGSMAKEHRLAAEQRLKKGELKCLVATASLELGIDIGDIDLVCQLGSPRSIAAFLQRVGRSGHAVDALPKGRLFPLSRDELVESTALLHAANHNEMDRIIMPPQPLDVLAQQIVAEVSGREWGVQALFDAFRCAWPYRALEKTSFDEVVRMLADGYSTRRGRRAAYIHFDTVNQRLRPRRAARLTALSNGGVIPDQFDYEVILTPEGFRVGTLNEDFAFESLPGDIFQLGNTSYRILKVETGKVYVEDAKGEPPNIPFWFGEAPGRSDELSQAVSRLRERIDAQLKAGIDATVHWLETEYQIPKVAAQQLTQYLATAKAAFGHLPTRQRIIFERFFDEAGDMHLVIHSPYGSRLNRAWGLALRKRFCRKFNFELQAAALEDSIVLSLSATHSFPLEEVTGYLKAKTVREVLIQALLAVPMFPTRWRWNATISLAVVRFRNGKRTPPYFQRSDAEDLVAVVFPDQIACGENIAGDREVPGHPLVKQTIDDCLHETMDINGLEQLLEQIETGEVTVTCCDLTAPSPLAQEILNARPYAFLDDAPAEERRTMAVRSRSFMDPAEAADLGKLDAAAIDKVREEAWPDVRTADELHDALIVFGFITHLEATTRAVKEQRLAFDWQHLFEVLVSEHRATRIEIPGGEKIWVAAERLAEVLITLPDCRSEPSLEPQVQPGLIEHADAALKEIIRSRLEGSGPVTADELAKPLAVSAQAIGIALIALEQEGFVVRGQFTGSGHEEWCERRLLARIHRYTVKRLRSEIEPVSAADYMRFLFHWQGLTDKRRGPDAINVVLDQLEGFSIAAAGWEQDILTARLDQYSLDLLDAVCASGRTSWMRLSVPAGTPGKKSSPVRHTPIALIDRQNISHWRKLVPLPEQTGASLGANAEKVSQSIQSSGAAFFVDIVQHTGLLRTQAEDALGELVNCGLVTSDNFSGLRALITPSSRRPGFSPRRGRRAVTSPFDRAGRWSLVNQLAGEAPDTTDIEFLAQVLLRRYGVVFRKVLERESMSVPWRDLLRVYWRMEARGEIRGGRFVQGVSGEQFALPDAVGSLRNIRRREKSNELVALSAADPLNLVGIILPGEKVTAILNNRILFRDGVPVALQAGNTIKYLADLDSSLEWQAKVLLIRKQRPADFVQHRT